MICDLRFTRARPERGWLVMATVVASFFILHSAVAFEGRINAVMIRGSQSDALLYTVDTNFLRVEMTATNSDQSRAGWPNPVDIFDRNSGELTLLFPNNRSFVRLKPVADNSSPMPPGFPQMPAGLPPGVGPQSAPGDSAMPGMPGGMPAMPMPMMPMPMMPGMTEKLKLQATGQKTNLLGFACEQYEIKQRGETMEIWATDQLFPFQPYVQNQPHRFGPRMIEEQWAEMVKAKKLFPLLAILRFEPPPAPAGAAPAAPGPERLRFEAQSVTPEKITDETLFQPPTNYFEIQPLPF